MPKERRLQAQQPNPDRKDTPTTTRATLDQETMPTEMANTAFIANCRITPKKSVSYESVKRNRVKTEGRAYWPRVYLTENSYSQTQGQQPGFH